MIMENILLIIGFIIIILLVVLLFRSKGVTVAIPEACKPAEEIPEESPVQHDPVERCKDNVNSTIISIAKEYYLVLDALLKGDTRRVEQSISSIAELNRRTKGMKREIPNVIRALEEDKIETGPYYVQVLDYLRESVHNLSYVARPIHEYLIPGNHTLLPEQKEELSGLNEDISEFYNFIINLLKGGKFDQLIEIIEKQQVILLLLSQINKKQLKRMKKGESGTRISMLYIDVLSETKNMLLNTVNILKSQRDFILNQ